MPRTARLLIPHTPHHIAQRGHNRAPIFAAPADYHYYLTTLREWKARLKVKVYAYCLMTNHVHLIVEPAADVTTVGKMMRRLAGRQTRYVNRLENRTGTLWEGRYKASPIQTERYLLACCRYVELNPVRASIVSSPRDYPWSSYRGKISRTPTSWIDEDVCFEALGETRSERTRHYARFVSKGGFEPDADAEFIATSLRRNQLTGDERFVDEIALRLGRRIEHREPGRPKGYKK